MLSKVILDYSPLIILFFLLFVSAKKGRVVAISPWLTLLFAVIIVLAIAGYPVEPNTDKDLYETRYYNTLWYGMDLEYKDVGWIAYDFVCAWLFGKHIYLFWFVTALLYVGSYCYFSISHFDNRRAFYFFLMTTGMLGFSVYGVHTIRQGLAIAFVIISLSKGINSFCRIILLVLAVSIHKSVFILCIAFVLARYLKNIKLFGALWCICLTISIFNIDFQSLFEDFGFVDNRISEYGSGEGPSNDYKVGFRWDFLLYSILPLFFSFYYIIKKKFKNDMYSFMLSAYLITNSIWILVIRMPYTDRVAYLSWFMIPFITISPLLELPQKFTHPQKRVLQIMLCFMGIHLLLLLR